MDTIGEIIGNLAEKAAEASSPKCDGDYIGEDGLLYCGKCRTPKQYRLPQEFAAYVPGGIMNCLCACEAARRDTERDQERAAQEQFMSKIYEGERRRNCFSDDFYKSMSFAADKGKAPKAIDAAHYFVDNFEKLSAQNMGLMFLGNVGTGKTFAACCIANALIEKGYSAWVVTASDLIRAAGNFNTSEETFFKLRGVDLLIVDDIGTQSNSEHNLGLLFDVIDKRYKAGKPLVVTSNLTAGELKNPQDMKLHRIYSRLNEACSCPISPVILTGKSIRDEIARSKHEAVI